MNEKDLVTKIEPLEENVVVENPQHDWERSCHQNRTSWIKCRCRKSATLGNITNLKKVGSSI